MEQALPELLTRYDTFILDSSLTLISPSGDFYPGVETTLSRLIEQHKQVIVFINHPLPPEACFKESFWQPWIKRGIRFFTSGGICLKLLAEQGYFSYFLFGGRLLPGMIFAPEITMAECVYLDLPALPLAFLPAENLIRTPEFPQLGFAPDITPFAPLLREAAAQNKVLYCARPALSETMFVGQRKVISNKAIVDYYRSQGGTAVEVGKPAPAAYEYILRSLPHIGKILCVGAVPEIDIRGAENLKNSGWDVSSLLVGISEKNAAELSGLSLRPDYTTAGFGLIF